MAAPKERSQISIRAERAVLAAVHLPKSRYDPRDPLGELRALAATAGVTAVGEMVQNRDYPEAATFMGKGKVEELERMCDELEAGVVIFDHELSPKQIANIEKITGRKVIDRSELILDIFASRATSRQAQLSVELAQLEYTYPRLRAMWDHLERIVGSGGIGGVGTRGPGEQQIEIDRRLVNKRKTVLRRELSDINERKRREVRDRRIDHYTVGLVGYTNAGKSTLFNTLTAGGAHANNQLFATLMTRTREWDLGGGQCVMLSDTVGFVRDLPHHLIASFRATLEEATHADCLLIVLDVADPAAEMQLQTVEETLQELFEEVREREEKDGVEWHEPARILLLNKADKLKDNTEMLVWRQRRPDAIPFCASEVGGMGQADLIQRIARLSRGTMRERMIVLPIRESKAVHFLETRCEVIDRDYDESRVRMRVRIGDRQLAQMRASGAHFEVDGEPARGGGRTGAWTS